MSIYIKLFPYACKYFVRDSITMIFYFHQDNDVSFKIDEKYHSYFWQKTFTKNLDLVRDLSCPWYLSLNREDHPIC